MGTMFGTDEPLWYNVGVWGELGFAVPNFGNDTGSINSTIHKLVSVIGRNLQAVMLHGDANRRTPPSINSCTRVHKLVVRARSILAGRAIAPGTPNMEAVHSTPARREFVIFPLPYFKVRNEFMKEWAGLALDALSEAMQHTENAQALEVSLNFSGLVGQYLHRIYRLMATELFGVPVADASKLDFTLTDAQLAAYDPGKYFTQTEMIDTVPLLASLPTEDDLETLTNGIVASQLVGLQRYPSGVQPAVSASGSPVAAGTTTSETVERSPRPRAPEPINAS